MPYSSQPYPADDPGDTVPIWVPESDVPVGYMKVKKTKPEPPPPPAPTPAPFGVFLNDLHDVADAVRGGVFQTKDVRLAWAGWGPVWTFESVQPVATFHAVFDIFAGPDVARVVVASTAKMEDVEDVGPAPVGWLFHQVREHQGDYTPQWMGDTVGGGWFIPVAFSRFQYMGGGTRHGLRVIYYPPDGQDPQDLKGAHLLNYWQDRAFVSAPELVDLYPSSLAAVATGTTLKLYPRPGLKAQFWADKGGAMVFSRMTPDLYKVLTPKGGKAPGFRADDVDEMAEEYLEAVAQQEAERERRRKAWEAWGHRFDRFSGVEF